MRLKQATKIEPSPAVGATARLQSLPPGRASVFLVVPLSNLSSPKRNERAPSLPLFSSGARKVPILKGNECLDTENWGSLL